MAERRKHRRYPKRFKVRYGEDKLNHVGFTGDISATGVFIAATPIPKLGTRLHIELVLEDNRSLFFEGVVQRQALVTPELRQMIKGGFGVQFLTSHELLAEMMPRLKVASSPEDAGAVVGGDRGSVVLRYETREDFRKAFDAELRRGGVFVRTETPLPVKTTIRVSFEVPFASRSFELAARVVQLAAADAAGRHGAALLFDDQPGALTTLKALLGP